MTGPQAIPVTPNTPVRAVNAVIAGATTVAENTLELCLTLIPYFGWVFKLPLVSQIVDILVKKYGEKLSQAFQVSADFIIIDKQTYNEGQAARGAAEALRASLTDPVAQKAFDDKYRDLIRMRG